MTERKINQELNWYLSGPNLAQKRRIIETCLVIANLRVSYKFYILISTLYLYVR